MWLQDAENREEPSGPLFRSGRLVCCLVFAVLVGSGNRGGSFDGALVVDRRWNVPRAGAHRPVVPELQLCAP